MLTLRKNAIMYISLDEFRELVHEGRTC